MRDIDRFPARTIPNGGSVFEFHQATPGRYDSVFAPIVLQRDDGTVTKDYDAFLEEQRTYAFLVIRRDTLIYERYFHGRDRRSVETTFSVSKSLVSIAAGIAVDSGWIQSVSDPITRYLPELATRDPRFGDITIEHLLTMQSGIAFDRGKVPWGDEARSYYSADLREVALTRRIAGPPGGRFVYNPYDPIVLGLAIERASGRTLTQLLGESVWSRIGAEQPASWSLDGRASSFEKMESGFNAAAIDLAKLGRLFLRRGDWDGTRILSAEWIDASVRPDSAGGRPNYGRFWWVRPVAGERNHYYAEGRFDQFVYVAPDRELIIVRTGEEPRDMSWSSMFEAIVRRVDAVDRR
jgi:CubicO group peptidase (beta-lactamase class C family)